MNLKDAHKLAKEQSAKQETDMLNYLQREMSIPKPTLNLEPIADMVEISDGYHTFNELYEHRITLFIALCRIYEKHVAPTVWNTIEGRTYDVWRSKLHGDGSRYEGWFLLGINKLKGEQITYHIPLSYWKDTEFAETLDRAPEFDGHTSKDVLFRLKKL